VGDVCGEVGTDFVGLPPGDVGVVDVPVEEPPVDDAPVEDAPVDGGLELELRVDDGDVG
jgi:hypothetical protein